MAEPSEFRRQLGEHGGLISGRFALNFFQLSPRKVQYLNILIKGDGHADQFEKYMMENEKYRIAEDNKDIRIAIRNPLIDYNY